VLSEEWAPLRLGLIVRGKTQGMTDSKERHSYGVNPLSGHLHLSV